MRAGLDTVLFCDTFNATTQNQNIWYYIAATLTCTQPGGYLQFSTVQGTANAHGAMVRSYQYFPLVGTSPLSVEFTGGVFAAQLVANEIFLAGLGLPAGAATAPTDGVYWKLTNAGLIGELMYNGVATQTGVLTDTMTLASMAKFTMVVGEGDVEFWIDDVLFGKIVIPAANGQPFMQAALPVFMQKYNTGVVANTNVIRVADITVSRMDVLLNKDSNTVAAGQGNAGYISQNGVVLPVSGSHTQAVGTITTGSSAITATAAGSNTAANATGLGGIGQLTASVSSATDVICTSYLNPVAAVGITGRNLFIKGIKISSINYGAAVATTPTTLMWSIGFGHTAVSMQTATTASFAAGGTTHAPNRLHIGYQSAAVATPIGGMYSPDIVLQFSTPIVVRPGEYINTFLKQIIGTATASQTILYNVFFDAYWE